MERRPRPGGQTASPVKRAVGFDLRANKKGPRWVIKRGPRLTVPR